MRLRTTRPAARRAWTVELRPGSSGPQLVCQQCDHQGALLTAVSGRSAALEHLADMPGVMCCRHTCGPASAMSEAAAGTPVTAVAPALSVCFSPANAADGSGDLPMHVRPARR
jgi:hypothetical protein